MKSIKQQLKLITAVCAIAASSFAAANTSNIGHLTTKATCNTSKEYCVLIKGDSSIRNISSASATVYYTITVAGTSYTKTATYDVSPTYGFMTYINAKEAKDQQITDIEVGVKAINGEPLSDCFIKASGNKIAPGLHNIVISELGYNFTCKPIG